MGGFQWSFLEQALNLRSVLPVRNRNRLLVPIDAFYKRIDAYYMRESGAVKQNKQYFSYLTAGVAMVAGTHLAKLAIWAHNAP